MPSNTMILYENLISRCIPGISKPYEICHMLLKLLSNMSKKNLKYKEKKPLVKLKCRILGKEI
jgi:hypothetical protein